MTDAPRWLSTAEAARRLGVTPRTLYRFIDSGSLPAYRMGRVIRLTLEDVDAFMASCRIQPGSLDVVPLADLPEGQGDETRR